MTEPVQAQIAAAHAQLVVAFSKEMADANGEMLAEYGVMDATEPLPQETIGASWTRRRQRRSTSTIRSSTLYFV